MGQKKRIVARFNLPLDERTLSDLADIERQTGETRAVIVRTAIHMRANQLYRRAHGNVPNQVNPEEKP